MSIKGAVWQSEPTAFRRNFQEIGTKKGAFQVLELILKSMRFLPSVGMTSSHIFDMGRE